MFATVLFDLDGTLVDPRVGIVGSLRYALSAYEADGIGPFDDATLESLIGPPFEEGLPSIGVPEDQVRTVIDRYRERYEPVGMYEATVIDGIAELLAALDAAGVAMGVATSKPAVFAERIVAHFGLAPYFRVVSGPTLDGRGRYKHEAIAGALEACPAGPALMVGDRSHDVVGARRCGLDAVGVLWGFGSRDELAAAGAWRIVERAGAVLDAVLASP